MVKTTRRKLLAAWGGIQSPTQGFSTRSAGLISLFNHLVLPPYPLYGLDLEEAFD